MSFFANCKPKSRRKPSSDNVPVSSEAETAPPPPSPSSDVNETRIEELGELMEIQGHYLDELSNQSRRLSSENAMLREKLSQGIENLATKPKRSNSPTKSVLRSIVLNHQKKNLPPATLKEEHEKVVQTFRDENELLLQQSDLLAKELASANDQIAVMDESIVTLGNELESCLQKARVCKSTEHSCGGCYCKISLSDTSHSYYPLPVTLEKNALRNEVKLKNNEIESLKSDVRKMNTMRSDLSSKANHLLAERKGLEAEVMALTLQITRSVSQSQDFQLQLTSKQSELDKLVEKCHQLERDVHTTKHETKVASATNTSLQESNRQMKQRNEQLGIALQETKDNLDDNRITQHKHETTIKAMQNEIQEMVEQHKADISSWTKDQQKIVAAVEHKYLSEIQPHEKLVDNLRRANSLLADDKAKYQRDLQSSNRRCSELEKLLIDRDNAQQSRVNDLSQRASEAEAKLDVSHSTEMELKRRISALERQIREMQDVNKDLGAKHGKEVDSLHKNLLSMKQDNQSLSIQVSSLKEELNAARLEFTKEKQKMNLAIERKMKEAIVENEALRASKLNGQLKLKEAQALYEKSASIHQATVDKMKAEMKDVYSELETNISDERDVSHRLMTKVQELNQAIQTLTAEKLQFKQQAKRYVDQINDLENIVANGEVRMGNLGRQYSTLVETNERLIGKEGDLKVELQGVRLELEKAKSKH
jgi:chromosome segregation ATPase